MQAATGKRTPRSLVLLGALATLLVLGTLGLYYYDASRSDLIAEGVRSGGVDLGGLPAPEAVDKLRRAVAASLSRDVVIRRGSQRWRLDRRKAGIRVDVRRMVEEAVARSRGGSIFTRTGRAITGWSPAVDLPARISYSEPAVARLVERLRRAVDRPPRDATVRPSGNRLAKIPGRTGAAVQAPKLRRRVEASLARLGEDRPVTVPWEHLRSEVMVSELVSKYPHYVVIDRAAFELRYYRRLRLSKTYTVAVGQQGFDTPGGLYDVQGKQVNPSWLVPSSSWAGDLAGRLIPPGPENPLKARWIGFNGSAGIHGTADTGSLGTAASHGCIRMSVPDVVELYKRVPLHTPVYVQ